MKMRVLSLMLGLCSVAAWGQVVPTKAVTKVPSTNRLTEDFKVPSARTVTVESGGTLRVETGGTLNVTGATITGLTSGFANPMTTAGDLILGGASGVAGRLGRGADGQFLGMTGTSVGWVSLDADLVSIAALATTSFGRSVLTVADAVALRTAAGAQVSGNYITALTGDVTASGPGSVAGTIANGAVTAAKLAATLDLSGKTVTLPSRNINGVAFNGGANITVPAALNTLTGGGNHKVIYLNGSGVPTELSLGTSGQVLQSNGATAAPSFVTPSGGLTNGDKGDITVAGGGSSLSIDSRSVSYGKMPLVANGKLLGRRSSVEGDMEEIVVGDKLVLLGTELNVVSSLATQAWVNARLAPILNTLVPTPYIYSVDPGVESVTLNWSSEAATWNVYRNDEVNNFAAVTTTFLATTNSPEYIDDGLEAETTYYYFITTTNERGLEGAPAATGAVTTGSNDPTYAPPLLLTVTATGGDTAMTFDWEEADIGPEIRIYRRSTYSGSPSLLTTLGSGFLTYTTIPLAGYYYMTSSDVGGGFESDESDVFIFPPVPVGPDVAVGNFNGLGLPVTDGGFDDTVYEVVIYRDGVPVLYGMESDTTSTDEFIPDLGAAYVYSTKLRDIDSGLFYGELSTATEKTIEITDAHFGWIVNGADEDSVSFSSISPPLGGTHWEIWVSSTDDFAEAEGAGVAVTTAATVTGLDPETDYWFWLVLVNDSGAGVFQESDSINQATSPEP